MRAALPNLPRTTSSCVPAKYRAPTYWSPAWRAATLSSFRSSRSLHSSAASGADFESCAKDTAGPRKRAKSTEMPMVRAAVFKVPSFVTRGADLYHRRRTPSIIRSTDEQGIFLFRTGALADGGTGTLAKCSHGSNEALQHRVNLTDGPGDGGFDGRHGVVDAAGQVADQLFGPLCLLGRDIGRAGRVCGHGLQVGDNRTHIGLEPGHGIADPPRGAHRDDDCRHLDDRHHRDRCRDDAEENVAHASCSPSPWRCASRARSNAVVMFSRCRLKISRPCSAACVARSRASRARRLT